MKQLAIDMIKSLFYVNLIFDTKVSNFVLPNWSIFLRYEIDLFLALGSEIQLHSVFIKFWFSWQMSFSLIKGARHTFASSAGRDTANPTAMLLCAANMLKHMHLEYHGDLIAKSVEKVIKSGKVNVYYDHFLYFLPLNLVIYP